jgi:hypothetical protein
LAYKWASPFDWLADSDVSASELLHIIKNHVDADVIQDHFQSSMEEDGYFAQEDGGELMVFVTDCVSIPVWDVDDLDDMVQESIEIDYESFVERVPEIELQRLFGDYNWEEGDNNGLTLKDDFMVFYFQSTYKDRVCYYLQHSAIEYIFQEPED